MVRIIFSCSHVIHSFMNDMSPPFDHDSCTMLKYFAEVLTFHMHVCHTVVIIWPFPFRSVKLSEEGPNLYSTFSANAPSIVVYRSSFLLSS